MNYIFKRDPHFPAVTADNTVGSDNKNNLADELYEKTPKLINSGNKFKFKASNIYSSLNPLIYNTLPLNKTAKENFCLNITYK